MTMLQTAFLWPSARIFGLALLLSALTACEKSEQQARPADVVTPDPGKSMARRPGRPAAPQDPEAFRFRLSEADPLAADRDGAPRAVVTPLAPADVDKLLTRLPKFEEAEGDRKDFALRDKSLPPPRTGPTEKTPFPPPPEPLPPNPGLQTPDGKPAPLVVLRRQPEGQVDIAPFLSVTFSQPMVPVTSQAELAKLPVPVQLTPNVEGEWRWLGTQTAQFQPKHHLPMATVFQGEVPVGTRSQTGGVLEQAVKWTFETPRPAVNYFMPQGESVELDTLLVVHYNQPVDPLSVVQTVAVRINGKPVAVQLATAEEIAAAPGIAGQIADAKTRGQDKRIVVFRPTATLPANAAVYVTFMPDVVALEGPRKSIQRQGYNFRTYAPLKLIASSCGYGNKCTPLQSFVLEFNNPLQRKSMRPTHFSVSPPIEDFKVTAWGSGVAVSGRTQGRTKYTVTVSPDVEDVFGQKLGKTETRTFTTTDAPAAMAGISGEFAVLDPYGKPVLPVWTVNHKAVQVEIRSVKPSLLNEWLRWQRRYDDEDGAKAVMPGKVVFSGKVSIESKRDAMVETGIDLSKALKDGAGHVLVEITPVGLTAKQRKEEPHLVLTHWLQVTQLGVSLAQDNRELVALVSKLKDGKPVPGAEVLLMDGAGKVLASGKSGADGIWRTPSPASAEGPLQVVAVQGNDSAMLPEHLSYWRHSETSWHMQDWHTGLQWYVADDRQLYKPGETVHVKGWLRQIDFSPNGDVSALAGKIPVSWKLNDSQGNEVATGQTALQDTFGFDFSVTLPKTINLGHGSLELIAGGAAGGSKHWHNIRIEEFRTPEFETTQQVQTQAHSLGGHGLVQVQAKYYAGGGLPGAPVSWNVTAQQGQFQPPNHGDFAFGKARPWWWWGQEEAAQTSGGLSTKSDAAGQSTLRIDFDSARLPVPWNVQVDSTVQDVNRQTWSSSSVLVVHPASFYIGLRQPRVFVLADTDVSVDVVAADWDGKRLVGEQAEVRFVRREWQDVDGDWKQVELDAASCAVTTATEPKACLFHPKKGGEWRLTATGKDKQGRETLTESIVWVTGGDVVPDRRVSADTVRLLPDKQDYKPGDTAKVLVIAPWPTGEVLVTVDRGGRLSDERHSLKDGQLTLQVPLTDAHTPGLTVQIHAVGSKPRSDANGQPMLKAPPQPAYASGSVYLSVPPRHRTLQVQLTPAAKQVAPGSTSQVQVQVTDATGQPLADAEILVVGVDDAVLALTGYTLPDPLGFFYPVRGTRVQHSDQRQWLQLSAADALQKLTDKLQEQMEDEAVGYGRGGGGGYGTKSIGMSGSGSGGVGDADGAMTERASNAPVRPLPAPAPMADKAEAPAAAKANRKKAVSKEPAPPTTPIVVRQNFTPLLVFAPTTRTDSTGKATVTLKFPDNLTRYRLMAVAVHGSKLFGTGESAVTARLPLMVRPSAPRFANFGDDFELPVVLQNQTDAPLTVDLAARATVLSLPLPGAKPGQPSRWGGQVVVPANNRVEVRLPTSARQAGTGRLQLGVTTAGFADAAQISLPVWTPATTEAFATYGVVDDGARRQPVQTPKNVAPQFGGLTVTTSSTALQALTDAVLYLVRYPYDCSEQIASRMLAIAALRDVLKAFAVPTMPSDDELKAQMASDIERLTKRQSYNGAFGLWRAGYEEWPWTTLHVMHALARAKDKGYAVPADVIKRGIRYLQQIDSHLPKWYGPQSRRVIQSLALYVRMLHGQRDAPGAKKLLASWTLDDAGLEGVGLILAVLAGDGKGGADSVKEVADLQAFLANRVVETAGAAHFVAEYKDDAYLTMASDRRADAIVLDALMSANPKSDLIPKVVTGLLAHRKKGHWGSTQENAWVLLALDRYFRLYESATPDFVARIWLGEDFAGSHAFKGRTTERKEVDIPMAWLAQGPPTRDLTIAKEGPGRLYYRIGMTYAPSDLKLPAMDRGFAVQRIYKAVDKPEDVVQQADGSWLIKAGSRVKVEVTMVAPTRRYHVALTDPLAAGLETINPALKGGEEPPAATVNSPGARMWWGRWFQHENLRDERAEAFTTLLWDGVWEYAYIARATTPGRFVVPPAKAEEMYSPEVFGRSASDVVVVK